MALERFSSFNVVIQGYDFMLERLEHSINVVELLQLARKDGGLNY